VFESPAMDDNEVPAAHPETKMGDCGQRAVSDCVVRSSDSLGPETDVLGGPRERQKIGAAAVDDYEPTCEIVIVDEITVTGGGGRERCRAAVVAPALVDEGEFRR
jgi:hypothetical protein